MRSGEWRQVVGGLAGAFAICLVLFSCLMVAAYCMPARWIEDNIVESAEILEQEGDGHPLVAKRAGMSLGNFTTSIMLNIAAHGHGISDAFANYWYQGPFKEGKALLSKTKALSEGLNRDPHDIKEDPTEWRSYSWYWHGYLVVLKPLLCLGNINAIRMSFLFLAGMFFAFDVALLARRDSIAAALALAFSLVAVNFMVTMLSLALSFTFLIALVATGIVILRWPKGESAFSGRGFSHWAVFFFVVGALTTYFDFLCTPLVTIGIPLATALFLSRNSLLATSSWKTVLKFLFFVVCWCLGYGILWAAKWVLASIVLQQNILALAIEEGGIRFGNIDSRGAGVSLTAWGAIKRQMLVLAPKAIWLLAGMAFIIATVLLAIKRRCPVPAPGVIVALLIIATAPYVWYALLLNHSWIHYYFTYRNQAVTLLVLGFVLVMFAEGAFSRKIERVPVKEDKPLGKHAAA